MVTWLPPFRFLPTFNIASLFFFLYFLLFVYSVFGILYVCFFVDLFCGNKSSSQKTEFTLQNFYAIKSPLFNISM